MGYPECEDLIWDVRRRRDRNMVGWMRVCWLTGEMVDRRGRRDAAHRHNAWLCIITGLDLSSNDDQHRRIGLHRPTTLASAIKSSKSAARDLLPPSSCDSALDVDARLPPRSVQVAHAGPGPLVVGLALRLHPRRQHRPPPAPPRARTGRGTE